MTVLVVMPTGTGYWHFFFGFRLSRAHPAARTERKGKGEGLSLKVRKVHLVSVEPSGRIAKAEHTESRR